MRLFEGYKKTLLEQGEQVPNPEQGFQTPPSPDVTENPDPTAAGNDEQVPMTSQGEDQYISDLIDAALFEPSSEDARTLTNLQGVMKLKKYRNAREEVLPLVLNIIRPSTESSSIRSGLDQLQN